MAWQRKVPFGYEIQNGILRSHPEEANAVKYIFSQYLTGASYQAIADAMAQQGIRYHQHTAEWNKNMVKRILENRKYIGADDYPRIIPDSDFLTAQLQRAERSTYAPLPNAIRPICHKIVCAACGVKMLRDTKSHGRAHWRCQNPDCKQMVAINDDSLRKLVDQQLQKLTQLPHLLAIPEPQKATLSADDIRLQNELTHALNRGSESHEYIKTLAFTAATQRYERLLDPTPAYELEQLKMQLEQGNVDDEAIQRLLDTAVRTIRLSPDKNVELELVNGKITPEKDVQSA